jgi:DNA-binding winged helix-turn-helix (wHTH) protein
MSAILSTSVIGEVHLGSNIYVTVFSSRYVCANETQVLLTEMEARIIEFLAGWGGRVCTSKMLIDHLYDGSPPQLKILDVYICKIRNKLEDALPGAGAAIRTVWGRGYAFGGVEKVSDVSTRGLPPVDTRWVPSRKLAVLEAYREEELSLNDILEIYPDLSHHEFKEWELLHKMYGVSGLRTTRTLNYMESV